MVSIFSDPIPKYLMEDSQFSQVSSVENEALYLYFYQGRLALMTPTIKEEKLRPFFLDFIGPFKYHQGQNYSLKKEPLAKAVGGNFQENPLIWDITCGTGSDSTLLLFFGAKIVAFERNPIMWALLRDALDRAQKDPEFGQIFRERFTLIKGDPRNYPSQEGPHAIYYDPMYPEIGRKALQKKEMRVIREVVGDDLDFNDIFDWAKGVSKSRFIVKRPTKSPLLETPPGHTYKGKSTRYDVYFSA